MKICVAVGARPQFIKAAAVVRGFAPLEGVEVLLVHSGQHYDSNMSKIFFDELGIVEPKYNLGVGSGSHGAMTGRMLEGFERIFIKEQPDAVVVFGDTNSTLAATLAASKMHIPVAHVEAGLRSFNRRMPEEMNRILTDHASDLLFAPTHGAVANLQAEGFDRVACNGRLVGTGDISAIAPEPRLVVNTGDVMFDAALHYGARAEAQSRILGDHGLVPDNYALATVHRAENTDDPERLEQIFTGLLECAKTMPVVLPLHPRTKAVLEGNGKSGAYLSGLTVLPPVSYLDMVQLEKHARIIFTDSGGVQKEACFHATPCITLRDETEWTELVESGWNTVVGASSAAIEEAFAKGLQERKVKALDVYGTGCSGQLIASMVERCFG